MDITPVRAAPAVAGQADELIADDRWAEAQKLDGVRCLIHVTDAGVKALSKQGKTLRCPAPVLNFFRPLARTEGARFCIDGELLRVGGFWPFDLVVARSPKATTVISPSTKYQERRKWLAHLVDLMGDSDHVKLLPEAVGTTAKQNLYDRVFAAGGEGVIFRHLEAPYRCGKEDRHGVIKVKFRHDIDCFVIDVERDGKANLAVAVLDGDQQVEIAEVGQTGDGAEIARRWKAEQRKPKGRRRPVIVNVIYQYASDDDHLIMPTYPTLRDDRGLETCTLDQLIYAQRAVLL
jgi:bifunctional non-homologous end joining protein LigD